MEKSEKYQLGSWVQCQDEGLIVTDRTVHEQPLAIPSRLLLRVNEDNQQNDGSLLTADSYKSLIITINSQHLTLRMGNNLVVSSNI